MAKRKPRKPRRRSPDTTLRAQLEALTAALLERQVERTLASTSGLDDDVATFARARILGEEPDEQAAKDYARKWRRRVALHVGACDDLRAFVHGWLDTNPIYLLGSPSEVADAIWTDLMHVGVSALVDALTTEADANGETRFLVDGEDYWPNPDFVEPGGPAPA